MVDFRDDLVVCKALTLGHVVELSRVCHPYIALQALGLRV